MRELDVRLIPRALEQKGTQERQAKARAGGGGGPAGPSQPLRTSREALARAFPARWSRSGRDLQQYQSQAKQLFRKLNEQSPTRCTLEAGAMAFHYIIEKGVCYLVLCEAAFPKKLAFAYLEDLHSEFDEQHGKKVPTVSRPYSFIEFDTYIQKTKKLYIDSRARRNLGSINTELQDVQRIMVANIEEVLQRGEALSALDSKANNLSSLSKKYRQDAKYLNMRSTYAKLAAVAVFFIMLIVYVRFWWL
ncbi:PREDICTED: vesicle-trafficking protein SEC22b [Nipponia nippon]|nr:PREDICTED: vesicle-trafficking protein SEC22b [Nipponia nippon]